MRPRQRQTRSTRGPAVTVATAFPQSRSITTVSGPSIARAASLRTRPDFSRSSQVRPFSLRRPFHSYDHPAPDGPFSPTECAILTAAYTHVPEHGFSQETLALGARDAGFLDISTNLLPHGVFSLIQWHLVSQREALAGRARGLFGSEDQGERMGVGWKVEALAWERLMGNRVVNGRWQEVSKTSRDQRTK